MKSEKNSCLLKFHSSMILPCTTIGVRYTRVDMDAGLAGSNMVMMNPAIAKLVDDFNAAERSKSYNMLDVAASTRYHASDNVDVVLGVSQKNRAPTYFERYTWLPLGISGGMVHVFNYTVGPAALVAGILNLISRCNLTQFFTFKILTLVRKFSFLAFKTACVSDITSR